jgi:hypothetical protein
MLPLALALVALALGVGLLGVIEWRESRSELVSVALRFGSDVTSETVTALIAAIAGLPHAARVVIEVKGDEHGLAYRLHAPRSALDVLRAQLRGILPSLRMEQLADDVEAIWTLTARLRWTGQHPVLQTDQPEQVAAGLLGSFSDLHRDEALRLLWILTPTRRPRLPQRDSPHGQATPWFLPAGPSLEHLRALRLKYAGPVVRAHAVVLVNSPHSGRARHLLARLTALMRSRQTSWGRLRVRRVRPRPLTSVAGWPRGSLFSPDELAGLIGWPVAAPRIPGLALASAPQLIPSSRLPNTGRVFARSDWPGLERRQLVQPIIGGLSHALIVGPTGSGKSHLMAGLIAQDVMAGRGCLVLDGKGDLAVEVLSRIPEARQDDVIVVDPGTGLPLPGLKVFGRGSDPELTADLVLGIFRELFADSWGVRSDKWLRAGLTTLAHDPRATLADLPFLFSNAAYRRSLVGRVHDPLLLDTWGAFEAMSPAERTHQLGSPLTKVSEVIGRRVVRGVLAQTEPTLDLRAVLHERRIVVVALSGGQIGSPAARLIGALVVHELFQAVQARGALSPQARQPFFAYIDEPKVLGDMPVPLDSLFELARGLGVGLTLGAQSLMQLPKLVTQAGLTNAATIVAFNQAADDAAMLARELVGLTAEELQGLGRFDVVARLGLGPGDVAPVATGVTLPLPEPISDPEVIRRLSAARFGRSLEDIDRALAERHQVASNAAPRRSAPDAPIGRVRRSS